MQFKEKEFEFILSSAGSHFAENSLGVLLCVDCLGGDIEQASRSREMETIGRKGALLKKFPYH